MCYNKRIPIVFSEKEERVDEMLKKINKVLRTVFIGFILIYTIVKIFDVVPKDTKEKRVRHVDKTTSEFDELC